MLAARKPSLHGALLAAKAAGHTHVIVDGTLIHTDRIATPAPPAGWTCGGAGKHQPSRREHPGRLRPRRLAIVDLRRCARAGSTTPPPPAPTPTCSPRSPPGSTTASSAWPTWATKARPETLRIPIKKTAGDRPDLDQQAYNAVHGALRCLGERANSLLKTTFKALRRCRGCPWRIGDIAAAALVLLHHEHHRTT